MEKMLNNLQRKKTPNNAAFRKILSLNIFFILKFIKDSYDLECAIQALVKWKVPPIHSVIRHFVSFLWFAIYFEIVKYENTTITLQFRGKNISFSVDHILVKISKTVKFLDLHICVILLYKRTGECWHCLHYTGDL